MQPMNQSYGDALAQERANFIMRTYGHLMGAIAAFTAIEAWLFSSGWAKVIAETLLGFSWLLVLGGFILVAWLGSHLAHTVQSRPMQYAALAAVVIAEAIIFVPLLYMAEAKAPGTISSAAGATLVGFTVLTGIVFVTRKNFSFLRPFLMWLGLLALVAIVVGVIFNMSLGPLFSLAMIAYAGGAILYDTSNVLYEYESDQHVAASLELFTSVAMLFWYVVRLFSSD